MALLAAPLVSVAGQATVGADPEAAARIPVVTRLVRVFADLEAKVADAVARRDRPVLSELVGDDFEMRTGDAPGRPIPRAAWLNQSFAEHLSSSDIGQMAVHDYDKLAVVSFLWKVKVAGAAARGDVFVVDMWVRDGDGWRLVTRYADPVGGGASITGAVPSDPGFEKKQ